MGERTVETDILVEAPPERVWRVLTDFAAMPSWNPFIRYIAGPLKPGARLSVHIAPPGQSGMRFRPRLLVVSPARELRWLGSVLVRGLFDGEHYFQFKPEGEGRTRFIHGEVFSGLMVGTLMRGAMLEGTRGGFKAMNAALKRQAEASTSSG